jgi:tetratricopeptide (TPR) repeat protein
MALRLSQPAAPGVSTPADGHLLPAQARSLVAAGDLAGYRALYAQAAAIADPQRRYAARKELLQAGLEAPRGAFKQVAHVFLAVATEGLAILDEEPSEPVLLNLTGVALYELGALAGAKTLFEAARRLDERLPAIDANLKQIERRRKQGVNLQLPPTVTTALRSLEADARRVAARAGAAQGHTLSLCMIVRDEEDMLGRSLAAAQDAVDEIIVVDTGSTDRTVEIAESFGATVLHHEWTGDFAEARNVSFDAATSDWIVYLDADEVLADGEAARLRALVGRTWREAFFLHEQNHTGDLEDGTSVHHNALRVFRNRPEYRFTGRIHEQIAHTLPAFIPERIETTDVRIEHFGYLGVVREEKDKSRRNLELLERQLSEQGESAFLRFNLGSEHAALGEHDSALEHFRAAWAQVKEDGNPRTFGFAPSLVGRLAACLRINRHLEELEAHVEEGLAIFPRFTDLVYELALGRFYAGELDAARTLFGRCLEMGDAPSVYSSTVGYGSYAAHVGLAETHRALGDPATAEAEARRALELNPRFLNAVELLAQELPGDEVAREVRAAVEEDTASLRFLLAVPLYEAGAVEAAETELRAVLERKPDATSARAALAEALLSQRRYAEAADTAAAMPAESPSAAAAARSELFARLAGALGDLDEVFERARTAGVTIEELAVFGAWRDIVTGAEPPAVVPEADLLLAIMEALVRVEDVDAFVALLPLVERTPLRPRERRERMAQLYLRRGLFESAADEWAAACQEEGPDADALAGLAATCFVRDLTEDAELFAKAALDLEPTHGGAHRVLARLAE